MSVPEIDSIAPSFALPTLDGDTIRLADYRGRRLLVFMWASW
jgi:peroxiredoxin